MAATEPQRAGLRLAALTSAALALPGMVPKAGADTAPVAPTVDTSFSRYEESNNRMRVDVYQAVGNLPLGDRVGFKANGVKDVVSGASPVANTLNGQGRLVQVKSRATIRDVRDEVDLSGSYYLDDLTLTVNAGRSSENDYTSNFFNLDGRWEVNDKLTTLAAGFGFASDTVWAVAENHVDKNATAREPGVGGDKSTFQSLLGLTQVLDKNSLFQANLTYNHSEGFLSDPYKFALVLAPIPGLEYRGGLGFIRDTRPGYRDQFSFLLRYIRNFSELNAAALHLDYRFYADTWGIGAHTFEATWYQPVWDGWQLAPRVRYYSQGAADFYQPIFATARVDGKYSSDYRMASFGAVSGGAQLSKTFLDRLRITAAIDLYKREKGFALAGGTGTSLDNYSFSMYSVGIDFKF